MDDKKADKNVQRTRELLEDCNTLVLSLFSVKPAQYNVVCVCLPMSTNVFIWIKHGTHRLFEQIRFPNFQNYPPIFRPRISDAP